MKTQSHKLPKLKGYIRAAGLYISHAHLLVLLAAVLTLGAVYTQTLHPMVVRFLISLQPMPKIVVNSVYMEGYSGMARLVLEDGSLLYEGKLINGMAEGRGLLYSDGVLVYKGEFQGNKFNGQGELYAAGRLEYQGNFVENRFSGTGTLYGKDGTIEYEGSFLNGEKNGRGRAYNAGKLLYEGSFIDGDYEGEGSLYDTVSGTLLYKGAFIGGDFNGLGEEYLNGTLLYAGSFANGSYEGTGILYDSSGSVVYDGQWASGCYKGQGRLFKNGALLYEGEFANGLYNGEGKEYYPESGYPRYIGKFLEGKYMEAGVFYDKKGRPIKNIPQLTPELLINLTYAETVDLIKDTGFEYSDMELDGAPLIVIEDIRRIIRFSKDLKSDAPGRVVTVYLCGLDVESGVLTSMVVEDIEKVLGTLTNMEKMIPGAVEILALTMSNDYWGRDVATKNTRGIVYNINDREITVFFEINDDMPGQALFFKVK